MSHPPKVTLKKAPSVNDSGVPISVATKKGEGLLPSHILSKELQHDQNHDAATKGHQSKEKMAWESKVNIFCAIVSVLALLATLFATVYYSDATLRHDQSNDTQNTIQLAASWGTAFDADTRLRISRLEYSLPLWTDQKMKLEALQYLFDEKKITSVDSDNPIEKSVYYKNDYLRRLLFLKDGGKLADVLKLVYAYQTAYKQVLNEFEVVTTFWHDAHASHDYQFETLISEHYMPNIQKRLPLLEHDTDLKATVVNEQGEWDWTLLDDNFNEWVTWHAKHPEKQKVP